MATQVSPGINISEIDKTLTTGPVALLEGAIAGVFKWGPVSDIITVNSEDDLVAKFGRPDNDSANYFFTAANFVSYGSAVRVIRVVNEDLARTATSDPGTAVATHTVTLQVSNTTAITSNANAFFVGQRLEVSNTTSDTVVVEVASRINSTALLLTYGPSANVTTGNVVAYRAGLIKNADTYENNFESGTSEVGAFAAKYAGDTGNGLTVEICADANAFSSTHTVSANIVATVGSTTAQFPVNPEPTVKVGDILYLGRQSRTVTAVNASSNVVTVSSKFSSSYSANTYTRTWKYAGQFGTAPVSADEMHIIVIDTEGKFADRVAGSVLEKYAFVSKASDAKTDVGASNYYKTVINRRSPYLWWTGHPTEGSGWGEPLATGTFTSTSNVLSFTLKGGADGAAVDDADIIQGYDLFKNETVEVSFILGANASSTVADYLLDDLVPARKYAMAFISPPAEAVIDNINGEVDAITEFRNGLTSTSYGVMDSGWKYQYDKYNDVYRYVPLNGDVAGCLVRTDLQSSPWLSPGGFTRGQIRNVVKLPFNPRQIDRDDLYRSGVNSVVSFPGQGTVLFGDKTLLDRPSAFDRINVRRLFITLEKTIERSAKQLLFEQNDDFTRRQFVNLVEPYLRSVQAGRGISDFFVVCDATNNPPDATDRGEFRADIYVKPVRSINFIQLNFVAVRSDVAFTEIVSSLT